MKHFVCIFFITAILVSGCAKKENMIIVMSDQQGQAGELQLDNDKGSTRLDQPGQVLLVGDDRSVEITGQGLDTQTKNDLFGDALAMTPKPPVSYLLYFNTNSLTLDQASSDTLKTVIQEIQGRENKDVMVIGHTDRAGKKEYNMTLSLKRAVFVRDLLIENGVDQSVIETISHGEGNPLVRTPDNQAEPKNRRVEVVIR